MGEKILNLIDPVMQDDACFIYDIEYIKESGERILRIYIDSDDGGVDLNDCERVSRLIDPVLDEYDIIPDRYRLQVGSPGVERRLNKFWHYKKYINSMVLLRLYAPLPETNTKKIKGILKEVADSYVMVEDIKIPVEKISICNLSVF